MTESDQEAFSRWFWGSTQEPFIGEHELSGADGAGPTTRRVVWHSVQASEPGVADARSLVGLELPTAPELGFPVHSGDGISNELATPR
jgi:hypothetical protein